MKSPVQFEFLVVVVGSLLAPIACSSAVLFNGKEHFGSSSGCYERWLQGYRLASGRPHRIIHSISLSMCEAECANTRGCAAFAYGTSGSANGSCEIATRNRISRMDTKNSTSILAPDDIKISPTYDVYIESASDRCYRTSPLFSSPMGTAAPCAVLIRRGGRLRSTPILSTHPATNSRQCEDLCSNNLFRCRAFAFRHTERGRDTQNDPYNRLPASSAMENCILYDADIRSLSSANIEPNPDYDLHEMGRLMAAECVLNDQNSRLPSGPVNTALSNPNERLTTAASYSTFRSYPYNNDRDRYSSGYYNRDRDDRDRMSYYSSGNYRDDRYRYGERGQDRQGQYPVTPRNSVCLVLLKQDSYLAPEASRASFTVKTLEECQAECLKSVEILRFPCKVMAYRIRAETSGNCQLSDQDQRELRETDYIPSKDRYEGGVTYFYDDRDSICRREDTRYQSAGGYYGGNYASGGGYNGGNYGSGSGYYGSSTRSNYGSALSSSYANNYGSAYGSSYGRGYGSGYGSGGGGSYGGSNYGGSSSGGRYYDRDRFYDNRGRYGDSQYGRYQSPVYQHQQQNHYASYNYRPPTSSSSYQSSSSRGYYDDNRRYDDYRRNDDNYNRYGYYEWYDTNRGNNRYPPVNENYGREREYERMGYYNGGGQTTVNGERCLRSCRQNREAGFFYCQVDDNGSWDFCCRPDHQCGYSRGLQIHWCYVGSGASENIWRSCNQQLQSSGNSRLPFSPQVAYLHEESPPKVQKLTTAQAANLTRDDTLQIFKISAPILEKEPQGVPSEVYKTAVIPLVIENVASSKSANKSA